MVIFESTEEGLTSEIEKAEGKKIWTSLKMLQFSVAINLFMLGVKCFFFSRLIDLYNNRKKLEEDLELLGIDSVSSELSTGMSGETLGFESSNGNGKKHIKEEPKIVEKQGGDEKINMLSENKENNNSKKVVPTS